jgi:hypothetical protein
MFFGLPKIEYCWDGGKTWEEHFSPMIGPGVRMRIVAQNGDVLFEAHAESREQVCDCCRGTGKQQVLHYVRDRGAA